MKRLNLKNVLESKEDLLSFCEVEYVKKSLIAIDADLLKTKNGGVFYFACKHFQTNKFDNGAKKIGLILKDEQEIKTKLLDSMSILSLDDKNNFLENTSVYTTTRYADEYNKKVSSWYENFIRSIEEMNLKEQDLLIIDHLPEIDFMLKYQDSYYIFDFLNFLKTISIKFDCCIIIAISDLIYFSNRKIFSKKIF